MQKQNSNDKKIILALIIMLFLLSKRSLTYNPELNNIVTVSFLIILLWQYEVKVKWSWKSSPSFNNVDRKSVV